MTALDDLWKDVLEGWDDDRPHAALIAYGQSTESLGRVAALYAGLRDDSTRGEGARKRLQQVTLCAQMAMAATKHARAPGLPRWFTAAVALFFGSLVAYVLFRLIGPLTR